MRKGKKFSEVFIEIEKGIVCPICGNKMETYLDIQNETNLKCSNCDYKAYDKDFDLKVSDNELLEK